MYTKDSVDFHSEGFGRRSHPAINVKVNNLNYVDDVVERFGCNEKQAEQALEFAFEAAQSLFWNEDAPDIAKRIFGNCKVYSEGRSGGWLVVFDLPDIESWDAVMLAKWHKFENEVKETVKYLTSKEEMLESIEANRWAEPGAEAYNFVDRQGQTFCLVDLKNQASQCLPDGMKVAKIIG